MNRLFKILAWLLFLFSLDGMPKPEHNQNQYHPLTDTNRYGKILVSKQQESQKHSYHQAVNSG